MSAWQRALQNGLIILKTDKSFKNIHSDGVGILHSKIAA